MKVPPHFKPATNGQVFVALERRNGFQVLFSATHDEQVVVDRDSHKVLAISFPDKCENWIDPSFML